MAEQTIKDFLTSIEIGHLLVKNVVDIDETEQIAQAFHKLLRYQILSLPVFSAGGGFKSYYGFVDIMDILLSYLQNKQEGTRLSYTKDIVNLSKRNPWLSLYCKDNLQYACAVLSGGSLPSVHRAAVFDTRPDLPPPEPSPQSPTQRLQHSDQEGSEGSSGSMLRGRQQEEKDVFFSLLSQSKIIQFVSENMDKFPHELGKTVQELGIGFREIISVNTTETVLAAMEKLRTHQINGVAIISDGKLVGNISPSDLKDVYIIPMGLSDVLNSTIADYLAYKRKAAIKSVTSRNTLADVIRLIVTHHIHRVYVTESGAPVGVITLSDILSLWA